METLNIKVNGKTDTCTLYATKEEAGDTPLSLKVGGNMAYAAMTTDLTDSEITKLRVKKNGTVYAVRKSAMPKEITCMLTIGSKITGGDYPSEEYGYYPGPTSAYGAISPKTFLGDEFAWIESNYLKADKYGIIEHDKWNFNIAVAKNPKKSTQFDLYDYENASHAYCVEIPQFQLTIKVGKGYTDNQEMIKGFVAIKSATLPSDEEKKRIFNLFKANAGKSVKMILTVISPPANTDTKN